MKIKLLSELKLILLPVQ